MLKDIRIHLAAEEADQEQLEKELSQHILANHRRNVMAFRRHIPSMVSEVQNVATQNIAIFANKNGEYNIVDYGAGRTVYGLNPQAEVESQYQCFRRHAPYIALNDVAETGVITSEKPLKEVDKVTDLPGYKKLMTYAPLSLDINVMVVMGLGLGYHIEQLVTQHNISHLIIYEPERQYFQCSVLALDWQRLLQKMEAKGTAVFLLLEKDGRDLIENIEELRQHVNVEGFYFFKHYNHAIFDRVEFALKQHTWSKIVNEGINLTRDDNPNLFLPVWSESIDLEKLASVDKSDPIFTANLSAFKNYFPSIYKEFANYCPVDWLPVINGRGETNLIQKESLAPFGGESPKHDARQSFEYFKAFPQKDGLVLGYTGKKLKKYKHYQFVEKTESLLKEIAEEAEQLPETVKSLIMFGIGLGYQLEALCAEHDVEKLFLCEPNRDFFYASLFAIDWHDILTTADKENRRIYINIGDDGTHLFKDLLSQFYSVGPYILASTYFYESYYNAHLVQALTQLREQLQIVISMGEYFDHALYGISHTSEVIKRGYPLLKANSAGKLSRAQKELPVFLVGNGPSLDDCIEVLKESQGKAIIISCGTALMPLYKNGITPDFHAEIEQNRSTFDWIVRIGDLEYLSKLSLISCNGIHPDTCNLFKDVFVAFKAGESSTVSALNILGPKDYEELHYAFPTVSNFALNLFTKIGFKQIYLFGIDLGFIDRTRHHSVNSGYYQQDGSELYDYSENSNTSLVVPGNFEKTVFTKHEFKLSKEILEQTLTSTKVECYNCSNGAKIKGSIALSSDDVLLVNSESESAEAIAIIKNKVFEPVPDATNYGETFAKQYNEETLNKELDKLLTLIREPLESVEQVDKLIEKQKNLLFASYQSGHSLLFYLLYGSMNYCNVLLSKCAYIKSEQSLSEYVSRLQDYWESFLLEVKSSAASISFNFDVSVSFSHKREMAYIRSYQQQTLYLTNVDLPDAFKTLNQRFFPSGNVEVRECSLNTLQNTDFALYERVQCAFWVSSQAEVDALMEIIKACPVSMPNIFWFGNDAADFDYSGLNHHCSVVLHPEFLRGEPGFQSLLEGKAPYWVKESIPFSALRYDFLSDYNRVIVPKLQLMESEYTELILSDYYERVLSNSTQYAYYLEFYGYIIFADYADLTANMLDIAGNRGMVFTKDKLHKEVLFLCSLTDNQIELYRETVDWGA